jgi:C4-type Zn-finger protein
MKQLERKFGSETKKSIKVPKTYLYKDNKNYPCPVCKQFVGLEHFLPGYNVPQYKHVLTEKTTTKGFYYYGNMD